MDYPIGSFCILRRKLENFGQVHLLKLSLKKQLELLMQFDTSLLGYFEVIRIMLVDFGMLASTYSQSNFNRFGRVMIKTGFTQIPPILLKRKVILNDDDNLTKRVNRRIKMPYIKIVERVNCFKVLPPNEYL